MTRPPQTPGAKMQYLIKRRAETSREELIAHWFANHMPGVIARQDRNRAAGTPHATHYTATLFDPESGEAQPWDGVAQLWYAAPLPHPAQASAVEPYDTFQQKVEPYWPWATREWVALDGALPLAPNTLNDAFPCTRSGFCKQVSLVAAKPGVDIDAFFDHWLDIHLPNVRDAMTKVGGFRYTVSLSIDMAHAPYAGMPELYFHDADARAEFWDILEPDGVHELIDPKTTLRFTSGTEMVGIE